MVGSTGVQLYDLAFAPGGRLDAVDGGRLFPVNAAGPQSRLIWFGASPFLMGEAAIAAQMQANHRGGNPVPCGTSAWSATGG